ncbi:MAG: DUF2029 domain-containing protein [Chloroflexi bacterium]|nr:DUF2029 domain-containing protein [Chloroflexota bacterium]
MTAVASAQKSVAAVLERWSGRPTLFAVAVMNAITGLGLAVTIAADNFGQDSGLFRRCALRLADGQPDFCGFLYSPLTALVARPLTWISPTSAMAAMTLIGLAIVLTGVALETRGQAPVDRLFVAIATVGFAPVVYELLLGQTTLLIAAAIYPVARRPDAFRNGIPFGIALALAPKPLLLPILVWMLVWRRQALSATALTTLLLTGVGISLLGVGQYQEWIAVLSGAGRESVGGTFILSARDTGNFSVWPLNLLTFVLGSFVAAAALWAIVRDPSKGFVASLFAGLLLAPYSLLYAFSILLLAVKPSLEFAPRTTRVLALIANIARSSPVAFMAWSIVGLSRCLTSRRSNEVRITESE